MIKFPMCWKCANKVIESVNDDNGDPKYGVLVGCKENSEIHNFADAQEKCPLVGLTKCQSVVQ